MARRKNVKRIDPRYFLDETVNRNDDGSALEECGEMDGEAIDISAPGTEVHVDDISELSPEEAFAAGMAAARDAIDQVMGGPDEVPPDGGFSGNGPFGEPVMQEIEQTRLDESKQHRKGLVRLQELAKIRNEADVVKGPWKPSKPRRWISAQRAAEEAAAKKSAPPGLKAVRPVVDPANKGMFQATKQAGKRQASRMAAARAAGSALGPAATAAGVGITAYQGTRAAMDAALPADSGLRKSSGEIYDYTDLGQLLGGEYKGTKEGDPADSLKINPNKPYNPYLDPEDTGLDYAGRLRSELKESGADVKAAGLPHNLSDAPALIAHVRTMLDGGKVTPQNAKKIDAALRSLLGQNQSPEDTEKLQALLRDVRAAGGIRDKRPDDSAWHRGEAAAELAAQKAGERSTFDSFSAMGLGTPKRGWEE